MNLTADVKSSVYACVVPVKCGEERGTAFFISKDTLLTARHIIADYVESKGAEDVIIYAEEPVVCEPEYIAEEGENIDVVLLKCVDYENKTQKDDPLFLKLLAAKFNLESNLLIIGYPQEFGHGSDLIGLAVRNRIEVKGQKYDCTVVREDTLQFNSYKGFSGSPVINERGSVIGVVLQQQNQGIGYLSIKKIADKLEVKKIEVHKDWQSEDFSPLGRGTSQKQVEKAINYASIRYNRALHVSDKSIDYDFDVFIQYGLEEKLKKQLSQIEAEAVKMYGVTIEQDKGYRIGNYEDLPNALERWNGKDKTRNLETYKFYNLYHANTRKIIKDWQSASTQRMFFHAKAGYGKTHYMCYTAERLSKTNHVYLLFGSWFSADLDFTAQLIKRLEIGNHTLTDLNEKMATDREIALIIIDAINEGGDTNFWQRAINLIEGRFGNYKYVKFILTFRDNEFSLSNSKWQERELFGFGDKANIAIPKYFDFYNIEDKNGILRKKYRTEFNEPLFLSIFCQIFSNLSSADLEDLTYSIMFRFYILKRNSTISVKIDEDPHKNVTYKFLDKLANYSLYYNKCQNVSREKARYYADQICRGRRWSQNLLYWSLRENLLIETGRSGDSLMFGYQKMGDFLMADVFKRSKMSPEEKFHRIIEVGGWQPYRRFVAALLTDWDLTPKLLKKPLSQLGGIMPAIIESVKYHGQCHSEIIDWLVDNGVVSVYTLHDYFDELTLEYFDKVHDILSNLTMAQRDQIWSLQVNRLYLDYNPQAFKRFLGVSADVNDEEMPQKFTIFLCWLSTSSHPIIRQTITRKLVAFFEKYQKMIDFAIDKFKDCNDPYVMQVITCASYGCLLRLRDAALSYHVASQVYKSMFIDGQAPIDIRIRQWTLLIFHFSDYLNQTSEFKNLAKPPFKSDNPYSLIKDKNIDGNKNYFGTNIGSQRLYDTLYGFSDFNRYILGANSHSESNVFFRIDERGGISLDDIQTILANIVKYEFEWNDQLGDLDKNQYSKGRYNNKTERFGKKYLWLALYRLDALMSDNFKVAKDLFGGISKKENMAKIPYPWYTDEYSHFDPSIINEDETLPISLSVAPFPPVDAVTNHDWLNKNYTIDFPRLIFGENKEWVALTCYDGYKEEAEQNTVKDFFLFTNAAFVKDADLTAYNNWAKEQNFYGRWMPERRNGSTDHLWREYTWADTYRRTIEDDDYLNYQPDGCPVKISLSYEAQLQEDWGELNEDEIWLREVAMPNHIIMGQLGLYVSERGIIRDMSRPDTKVAVNFQMNELRGLAIRREYLEKFLRKNGYAMVFYTLGEKYVRGKGNYQTIGLRHDLSGAYFYNNGKIETVQSMHIVDSWPKAKE